MSDREIFKELNGINYDEEEVKDYIDIANTQR